MKFLDQASLIITTIEASLAVLERTLLIKEKVRSLFGFRNAGLTYENDFINEELHIEDQQGRRAVLRRTFGVKVLSRERAIIRQLCWGDGDPLAHFRVRGARKLGVANEGMKKVILLGLPYSLHKPTWILHTRRLIRDEFTDRRGYFEVQVDRPTKRFSLRVVFPSRRPPQEVEITSAPALQNVPSVRRTHVGGRTALVWNLRNPVPFAQYSMRWSW